MKFVIQRVNSASVKVGNEIVGSIGRGLLVLIGLTHNDKYSDIEFTTNKLLNIRLFDDDKGNRWKESVKSLDLEILLVSQFTLYSILKGNKPDFHNALGPDEALKMYNIFLESLSNKHPGKVQAGKFGEHMEVSLVNDGPVTINWEYPEVQDDKKVEKVEKIESKQNKQKKEKVEKVEKVETKEININQIQDTDKKI